MSNEKCQSCTGVSTDYLIDVMRKANIYYDWADKLANAIANALGVDIGEHSSGNCPWQNALNAIASAEEMVWPNRDTEDTGAKTPDDFATDYASEMPENASELVEVERAIRVNNKTMIIKNTVEDDYSCVEWEWVK